MSQKVSPDHHDIAIPNQEVAPIIISAVIPQTDAYLKKTVSPCSSRTKVAPSSVSIVKDGKPQRAVARPSQKATKPYSPPPKPIPAHNITRGYMPPCFMTVKRPIPMWAPHIPAAVGNPNSRNQALFVCRFHCGIGKLGQLTSRTIMAAATIAPKPMSAALP